MGGDHRTSKPPAAGLLQLPARAADPKLRHGDRVVSTGTGVACLPLLGRRVLGAAGSRRRPELLAGLRSCPRAGLTNAWCPTAAPISPRAGCAALRRNC